MVGADEVMQKQEIKRSRKLNGYVEEEEEEEE